MPVTTFRERMVGAVGPVACTPWTLRPRGPAAGEGILRTAARTAGSRPTVLDLDDLHVRVDGVDPERDGFTATVLRGTVTGLADEPLTLVHGFADVLAIAGAERHMHYRLVVRSARDAWVVDGLKVVHGGVRRAWAATTTLHTVVVRVPSDAVPDDPAHAAAWAEHGGTQGEVAAAGVLRVRGLLRQGASLRGRVLPFLVGFARRTLRP